MSLTTEPSVLPEIPVSVLDLVPVGDGSTAEAAVADSMRLAARADELGFTRYWFAEHHNMAGVASSAPAVLIGAAAAATRRIRVGSGGVMLPNHAPLVVAEQFGTLAALYPGRIDLGLGRAPGTDPLTAAALRRGTGSGPDDFPEQVGELGCLLAGEWPAGHPYADRLRAVPHAGSPATIWLLGSSLYSAELAGLLGLPFAFAHHFSSGATIAAMRRYRDSFRPGRVLDGPHAVVTAQVVCADTDAEAERLALPAALSFLRLRQGAPGPLPTPDQAAAHPWTDTERAFVAHRQQDQAIGSPRTVADRLAALLAATGADELMITTQAHSITTRLETLGHVAALFGTAAAAPARAVAARPA